MKNLLNCHCIGLHSFPISIDENGFYKRVFYADTNHELWKYLQIAIHPHHTDIKITVLKGELHNDIYEIAEYGQTLKKFSWESRILNGKGGFVFLGQEKLNQISSKIYRKGESVTMKASDLHTVYVEKGKVCAWLIEETKPTGNYSPINYSFRDLENWNSDGLYIETDEKVKKKYIGEFKL